VPLAARFASHEEWLMEVKMRHLLTGLICMLLAAEAGAATARGCASSSRARSAPPDRCRHCS
jgi:hypothetical protein